MNHKLKSEERPKELAQLHGFEAVADRDAIHREFVLRDSSEAYGFMTRVATHAQQANHHPEWFNVYQTFDIMLATHEAGGITERDIALARFIDGVAKGIERK